MDGLLQSTEADEVDDVMAAVALALRREADLKEAPTGLVRLPADVLSDDDDDDQAWPRPLFLCQNFQEVAAPTIEAVMIPKSKSF